MPKCTHLNCGSANVIRVNDHFAKFPYWRCMKCKRYFMEAEHRLAIIRTMCNEPNKQHLRNIDAGTFLESYIEFISRTDPKGTGALFKKYIEEHDPEFYERVTTPTTHDRDRRRKFEGNDDGMNNTWRPPDKSEQSLDAFAP